MWRAVVTALHAMKVCGTQGKYTLSNLRCMAACVQGPALSTHSI